MPGPLELRELKRRERRAPLASAVQDAAGKLKAERGAVTRSGFAGQNAHEMN